MSELYIKGYVNGEPVYGEELTAEEIVVALNASPEWSEFTARFAWPNDYNKNLFDLVIEEKLGPNPDLADYQRLFKTVIAAGGVVRLKNGKRYEFEVAPAIEPVVEPEVPRDKNGNVLSASQLAWQSYREWSENHSSADCKARARTDAGYGTFYRKNLEREAQGTESTQFKLAGQQPSKPNVAGVSPELIAFAQEFKKTPMDRVRVLRNPSLSPLTFEKYSQQLEAAIAAGLV
jgi:hypothetical protein